MAAEATRAPVAREQELAPGAQPRLSIAEIDRALRSGPRITPSRTDPWCGAPQPGSRWTKPQNITLRLELERARTSRDPWAAGAIERLKDPERVTPHRVERRVHPQGNGSLKPVYRVFHLPLLATSRDGMRVLVVLPGGDKAWIDARTPTGARPGFKPLLAAIALPWAVAALGAWALL